MTAQHRAEGGDVSTDTENPCKADWPRRERAYNDCALRERVGDMERRIQFEVGYDHCAHPEACGGGGHGRHGMNMRFVLIGPKGAVQWLVYMTNWYPGNVSIIGDIPSTEPISCVPAHTRIGDGMAADLGYHSPVEHYDDQGQNACEFLPDGYCFYDGSGLNAQPILEAFLSHGPAAVWAALGRYYGEALA